MSQKLSRYIHRKLFKPQSSSYFSTFNFNEEHHHHRHCPTATVLRSRDWRQIAPPFLPRTRFEGTQVRFLNGSSLSLFSLFHSCNDNSQYNYHYQVSCILPHSPCLSTLQTQMLNSYTRGIYVNSILVNSQSRMLHVGVKDGSDSELEANDIVESNADPKEVDRVCKIVEELFALDRNMEAVLDDCGIELTSDLVVNVLERFRHARRPAFHFFCWAGKKHGFSHDSRTYNCMMRVLGKTRQFETMVTLLEEMGEKGLLTIDTFHICIREFAAAKERKKAVGIFHLMKKYKFKIGVDTVNCLLDNLRKARLGNEAQILFDRLKGTFTPNLETYTVLLNGWCAVRNFLEAGKIWNEMIDNGLKPYIFAHNVMLEGLLLNGWCAVRNFLEAGKIWNEMIDNGLKPDIFAHNVMLEGLLIGHKRSDAIKLFEVMKAKGPRPDLRSYTVLIRALCKHKIMDEAVEFFDEMIGTGCNPDVAIYTCLITGFGNQARMDKVHELLKQVKERGCPRDRRTYNSLIKIMTKRRKPDDAMRIYKEMLQNGIQPNESTYVMILRSYFRTNNYDMACSVWEEMKRNGCCPDDTSYITLIGGLIRMSRSIEACKYLEEMIEKGMKVPELDYNKFAADFSRTGNPDILEELAQKMKFAGKFDVSNVFAKWAEMTKKLVKRIS